MRNIERKKYQDIIDVDIADFNSDDYINFRYLNFIYEFIEDKCRDHLKEDHILKHNYFHYLEICNFIINQYYDYFIRVELEKTYRSMYDIYIKKDCMSAIFQSIEDLTHTSYFLNDKYKDEITNFIHPFYNLPSHDTFEIIETLNI